MKTEIRVTVKPANGEWSKAEEIIKKICEAYKQKADCGLHIEVENVNRP